MAVETVTDCDVLILVTDSRSLHADNYGGRLMPFCVLAL